jgi:hypothetical protein
LTAQGHDLQGAIERGNIVIAEATARELGRITLDEALLLTAPVADVRSLDHSLRQKVPQFADLS